MFLIHYNINNNNKVLYLEAADNVLRVLMRKITEDFVGDILDYSLSALNKNLRKLHLAAIQKEDQIILIRWKFNTTKLTTCKL